MRAPTRRDLICRSAAATLLPALAGRGHTDIPEEQDRVHGAVGQRLDAELGRFAQYGFSGAVLVFANGQIVVNKGYGLANVELGVANRAATRFEMNSMTKMFTAAAVLQLVGAGRIVLDAPVDTYLGPFPPEKSGATVRHLCEHTSGLVVQGSDLASDSRATFIADVKRTPRESAPGERYRYTNAGYSLLAAIIETVSNLSYEAYLRRFVLGAADMRSALFRTELPANQPLFAHGYVGTPAHIEAGPANPYGWGTTGAGGVWCTLADFNRYLSALEQPGRILPAQQLSTLSQPPHPPSQEAFGWHAESDTRGRSLMAKGGGSDDFASQLLYYRSDGVRIIWASNNLRQRWRRTLNRVLPQIVFDGTGTSLPAVAALSDATLRVRARTYRAGDVMLSLRAGTGFLYAEKNTSGVPDNLMFYPQDARHFTAFDPSANAVAKLAFDDAGRASFTLADGRVIEADAA